MSSQWVASVSWSHVRALTMWSGWRASARATALGPVATGKRHHHSGAVAGALHQRGHRGLFGAADDQIALIMAGL